MILAHLKFEFGRYNGEIILIDEILSPDSIPLLGQDDLRARWIAG